MTTALDRKARTAYGRAKHRDRHHRQLERREAYRFRLIAPGTLVVQSPPAPTDYFAYLRLSFLHKANQLAVPIS